MHLGAAVRARRKELGLTQDAVADRIESNRNYVGMLERGERNPTFLVLLRLAGALDIPAHELVATAEQAIRRGEAA